MQPFCAGTHLEIGFGSGLNFLQSWWQHAQRWQTAPQDAIRLHYIVLEPQPLARAALREVMQQAMDKAKLTAELGSLAERLLRVWPEHLRGVHRLLLDEPNLTLTLAVGEVGEMIGQLRLCADEVRFNATSVGHAPLWEPRILKHCARLSRSGARLFAPYADDAQKAAWLSALHSAGYQVEAAGALAPATVQDGNTLFARPRWHTSTRTTQRLAGEEQHAIVVGAGIAGAALGDRLAQRGWRVTLLDREAEPARGASGLWLGAMHPHFSEDDCHLSRTSRAAMQLAVQRFNELLAHAPGCGWHPCGVAHPATSAQEEAAMRELCVRLQLPAQVVAFAEREALSALAGAALPFGGYWHAHTGVVDVRRLVQHLITQRGIEWRPSSLVQRVQRITVAEDARSCWQAIGPQGEMLAEAPVLIVANAGDANALLPQLETMHPVRGQMSALPASQMAAPRAAVVGFGYVLPAVDGRVSLGATYEPGSTSKQVKQSDHALNLQSLATLMPHGPPLPEGVEMESFVGVRYAARDHLPLIGPVPDVSNTAWLAKAAGKRLTDLPRHEGLYCAVGYGSRGLSWSVLAGELLAAHLMNEPAPLESSLMDAVDPARFVMRGLRRTESSNVRS
jgi:tRNA 5-methylaminomethyl-2-thiouridine biosynthesis bifunctional protein